MPPGLKLKYTAFHPHSEFMSTVGTQEETAIVAKKKLLGERHVRTVTQAQWRPIRACVSFFSARHVYAMVKNNMACDSKRPENSYQMEHISSVCTLRPADYFALIFYTLVSCEMLSW